MSVKPQKNTPPQDVTDDDEFKRIAEKVRSGEYYQEARQMYDLSIHDPMAERYWFLIITVLSLLIALISFFAMQSLYPLQTPVPFIVNSNDIVEDLPRIASITEEKAEKPSDALLRFMVNNYVTFREEYDIDTFDRNLSGIKSQSSEEVYKEFQQRIDPHNPESPITLYQRHSRRSIDIISSKRIADQDFGMEVIYDATVSSKTDIKKSRWQANIAFSYSGVELDDEGKVKPVKFVVTQYRTKRLQDVK
jgi:type IV secretory pathway component VirB8